MNRLFFKRAISRAFGAEPELATDNGTTPADLYERLQEEAEQSLASDRRRRAESRAIRRFVAGQPKRLVVLADLTPPGAPAEPITSQFPESLPREWVGSDLVTRLEARRA